MTQEDKDLLLRDICARLPYGVICQMEDRLIINDSPFYNYTLSERDITLFRNHKDFYIKPYLRSMSSMTEEEKKELERLSDEYFGKALDKQIQESLSSSNRNESRILEYIASSVIVDWLNKKMFDFRGLIPKGLAISTEMFNPYKDKD